MHVCVSSLLRFPVALVRLYLLHTLNCECLVMAVFKKEARSLSLNPGEQMCFGI